MSLGSDIHVLLPGNSLAAGDQQTFNSEAHEWPEWGKADDVQLIASHGSPADCCNYSRSDARDTTGCCAVQRYRQRWMGQFWVGVKAFEILPDVRHSGCARIRDATECNEREKCMYEVGVGCIESDESGPCHPCRSREYEADDEEDQQRCVDRCQAENEQNGRLVFKLDKMVIRNVSDSATLSIQLSSKPVSTVTVLLRTRLCELCVEDNCDKAAQSHRLTFNYRTWNTPITLRLVPMVCDPQSPVPPTTTVELTTSSRDQNFHNLRTSPVIVCTTFGRQCPALYIPSNANMTRNVPGIFRSQSAISSRVLAPKVSSKDGESLSSKSRMLSSSVR